VSGWVAGDADPGPLARLEGVKGDPSAPSVIFQRVAEGETLRDVARAWGLPRGRFVEWFSTEHSELYDRALKVRADELAHETLEIADGATAEDSAPRKLRVDTRLKLAEKWDRARYGKQVQHTHSHTHDLGEILRRARERVIEQGPETVTLGAADSSASNPERLPAPSAVVDADVISDGVI
jgi:hypothetical protein